MPLKILLCGDVQGKLTDLYKKVNSLQKKKGNFDMLFCIGDFFGSDLSFLDVYKTKQRIAEVETYIISPLRKEYEGILDKNGSQICENITYLGYKGVLELKNKLKVAFLSTESPDVEDALDLTQTLRCMNIGYSGIDLFFSNSWPQNVENGSQTFSFTEKIKEVSSAICAALSVVIQPRYHIVGRSEHFFEREPYRKHKVTHSKLKHFTRFISLGSVKNKNNEKYLYAVNITPMSEMTPEALAAQPKSITDNPFSEIEPYQILKEQVQQFFFDTTSIKRKSIQDTNSDPVTKKKKIVEAGCWFCLGNPQVEKHLIVHVGMEAYLAMPKGPLDVRHVMIITIGHYQSLVSAPPHVSKEIRILMKCIVNFFKSLGKAAVFFERNFKTNHFQMQAVPIDESRLENCRHLFLQMGDSETGPGQKFCEVSSKTEINEIIKPGIPYMYVEMSNGIKLFGAIPKNKLNTFDIQFARSILSHPDVLNCPEKVQWKDCMVTEDLEEEMAKNLEGEIKPFIQKM